MPSARCRRRVGGDGPRAQPLAIFISRARQPNREIRRKITGRPPTAGTQGPLRPASAPRPVFQAGDAGISRRGVARREPCRQTAQPRHWPAGAECLDRRSCHVSTDNITCLHQIVKEPLEQSPNVRPNSLPRNALRQQRLSAPALWRTARPTGGLALSACAAMSWENRCSVPARGGETSAVICGSPYQKYHAWGHGLPRCRETWDRAMGDSQIRVPLAVQ